MPVRKILTLLKGDKRKNTPKSKKSPDKKRLILGIGSQWSGTLMLHRLLSEAGGIAMHPLVELHYFDTLFGIRDKRVLQDYTSDIYRREREKLDSEYGGKYINSSHETLFNSSRILSGIKNIADIDYYSLYEPLYENISVTGEITPEYMLLDEKEIAYMRSVLGEDTDILLIAMDPVDRFLRALAMTGEDISKPLDLKRLGEIISDMREWMRQQEKFADYRGTVERYSKYFSNIFIVSYEKILSEDEDHIKEFEKFIGRELRRGTMTSIIEDERRGYSTLDTDSDAEYLLRKRFADSLDYLKSRFGNIYEKSKPSIPSRLTSEIAFLEKTPLFDRDYYIKNCSDLQYSGMKPCEHYAMIGKFAGCNPNRWFDTVRYRISSSIDSDINPLIDYAQRGWREDIDPSADFDISEYIRKYGEYIGESEPLTYHIVEGASRGFTPISSKNLSTVIIDPNSSVLKELSPDIYSVVSFADIKNTTDIPKIYNPENLKISFVIPDFKAGSGGHMTIFRISRYLEIFGHEITIWIYDPSWHESEDEAYEDIIYHFQTLKAEVKFADENFINKARGDIVVATAWNTAWIAKSAVNFKRAFYFVQDYEPMFYPEGSRRILAEKSYQLGLDVISAGEWLKSIMENRYSLFCRSFHLAADKDIFYPPEKKAPSTLQRIAFYGRYFTDRRAVELGLAALEILAKRGIKFHLDLFGADFSHIKKAPYSLAIHGVLSPEELAKLYRQADIGMVFSMSNYSLVPLEMMRCKLPVIECETKSTKTVYPEGCVAFAKLDAEAIADKIEEMINSNEMREEIAQKAYHWANRFEWEESAREVEKAFTQRLEKFSFEKISSKRSNTPFTSIIIPTLNGGELFKKVIDSVFAQKVPWSFEVMVIDSDSDDGTWEYIQSRKDIRSYRIKRSEFNHGATRNYGASLSRGEYILFLTQDAVPSKGWLYNLVAPMIHCGSAAGAFGRHKAHRDASYFTKIMIENHFERLRELPLCVSIDSDKNRYERDISYRQMLHFFSDNSSCLRKSVWEKIPYPEVPYGEDQLWAQAVLDAGYSKIYAYGSIVYHSHDYYANEQYERSLIDGDYFRYFWGYSSVGGDIGTEIAKTKAEIEKLGKEAGLNRYKIENRIEIEEARLRGLFDGERREKSMFEGFERCIKR